MQDSLEKHLDEDIRRTLKFSAALTPAQKAAAWERLQARVQEQTMLPSLEAVANAERARWVDAVLALCDGSFRLLHTLFMDSAAFERANLPKSRFLYPYFGIHGRFTHPFMAFSA